MFSEQSDRAMCRQDRCINYAYHFDGLYDSLKLGRLNSMAAKNPQSTDIRSYSRLNESIWVRGVGGCEHTF